MLYAKAKKGREEEIEKGIINTVDVKSLKLEEPRI
jgi:hypothetical protein